MALLGLGEAAPGALPVEVRIEAHDLALEVTVDGQSHHLWSELRDGWRGIALEQPGPLDREYQIDGSDTTATGDLQPRVIGNLLDSPLYHFDAWLRDESSYSRWERLRIIDLGTGQTLANDSLLPTDFRVEAGLRRPEAPARLWLLGAGDDDREGLELDRDRRNARWLTQRAGGIDTLPRWFFPEQPGPFAAEILHLAGRGAAAGYALAVAALLAAMGLRRIDRTVNTEHLRSRAGAIVADGAFAQLLLALWLLAAALTTTRLYHQLPHILDAVSYTFQAGLLADGRLALHAPPLVAAFRGPFEVLWQGRLFSQYPPGAPVAYGLGQLVGLRWLVGPVACVALIGATSWTAGALFGSGCGRVVLGLGVLSPFVLFQAGSFLSHPVTGGLLAGALAAFVAAERRGRQRWYATAGVLLGASFTTREAASVLFAVPLLARLLTTRRWRSFLVLVVCSLPFALLYLLYNAALTGSPLLLPRSIFDPSDRFGFGDGIGFHTRHTLAAGLANTDELLTLLQLDLFGWPPLFALGLLGVPFLFGRARTWDALALCGVLVFVVAYVGYFYHGVALGPRYYFEALPWLLLLAGRGAQTLASLAGSRAAMAVVLGTLSLSTLLFYVPAELQRRTDLGGTYGGRRVSLGFVESSVIGPHVVGVAIPALVVTSDWWLYNTGLAALNCPRLPDCAVLFALATSADDEQALRTQYPDRAFFRTVEREGRIELIAG